MGKRIPDETKAAMLADLKAGKGCDEIAATHGVGRQSVFTLREKHRDELPAWKRRTAAGVMEAAGKIVDRINREAESKTASLKDLSICAGILISKQAELSGAPSTIVEHRHELGQSMAGWVGNRAENTAQHSTKEANVVEINTKTENAHEMEARKPPDMD
tara:strand:- start:37 stop:516 length:480 start_codon:yes stop_codon:yes gene_type:complete